MIEDGDIDLGHGVIARWVSDDELLWKHPGCRAWSSLCFDARSTGHVLAVRDPITILGSLLCPKEGCGFHGLVINGKWKPA